MVFPRKVRFKKRIHDQLSKGIYENHRIISTKSLRLQANTVYKLLKTVSSFPKLLVKKQTLNCYL